MRSIAIAALAVPTTIPITPIIGIGIRSVAI